MSKYLNLLGLESGATIAQIKTAWRKLAKLNHPDYGGDAGAFNKLRNAYKKALEEANKPVLCPDCKGSRRIYTNYGFATTTLTCRNCKGTGELKFHE